MSELVGDAAFSSLEVGTIRHIDDLTVSGAITVGGDVNLLDTSVHARQFVAYSEDKAWRVELKINDSGDVTFNRVNTVSGIADDKTTYEPNFS